MAGRAWHETWLRVGVKGLSDSFPLRDRSVLWRTLDKERSQPAPRQLFRGDRKGKHFPNTAVPLEKKKAKMEGKEEGPNALGLKILRYH